MLKHVRKAALAALIVAPASFVQPAMAGPLLPLVQIAPIDFTSAACAPFGDFIGCSTAILNFLQTGQQNQGDYRINASQGNLSMDDHIVVYGNASATNNPTASGAAATPLGGVVMDDAFDSSGPPSMVMGFSTNMSVSAAETAAGVVPEPDPGGAGQFGGDGPDSWDIMLDELLFALTDPATMAVKDPLFVFDNNQQGSDPAQSLRLWGLVRVWDVDGLAGNPDLVFEFGGCDADGAPGPNGNPSGCALNPFVLTPQGDTTFTDPTLFSARTAWGGDPLVDHYVVVDGEFCTDATLIQQVPCDGTETHKFNNNLGTNVAEFVGWLPELTGPALAALFAAGYDRLSMDVRFFDQTNGFEDLYILSGMSGDIPEFVPEPAALGLVGVALLAMGAVRVRRRAG